MLVLALDNPINWDGHHLTRWDLVLACNENTHNHKLENPTLKNIAADVNPLKGFEIEELDRHQAEACAALESSFVSVEKIIESYQVKSENDESSTVDLICSAVGELEDIIILGATLADIGQILYNAIVSSFLSQGLKTFYEDAFFYASSLVKKMGAYYFNFMGVTRDFLPAVQKDLLSSVQSISEVSSIDPQSLNDLDGMSSEIDYIYTRMFGNNSNAFMDDGQFELTSQEQIDLANYIQQMDDNEWLAYAGYTQLGSDIMGKCSCLRKTSRTSQERLIICLSELDDMVYELFDGMQELQENE